MNIYKGSASQSLNPFLSFYCTEDFNSHILDPDLKSEQLEQLHHEALELYHSYMVTSALDRIDFPTHIVSQIRESEDHYF